ncbi:uncharacterized protein TRIADDRAFT_56536 [Trichoplax adhaerens]|uniref:Exportin-4 n=1 Tax=Trichoplax adhaerens TaxID=10228 RepID=B3RYF1_TRIAD|nr:hypothetical protein TRIADDRAFT_56536 [Trichoplax adhaerens]EDV24587.1 hypothetical protein TRIADDRAFT_56536 [Trichoplax adhaerens]|eukprot:XP_002112477.1 hypothetical protein TRIADDRAFT_56536 [Trichoplax adhaerens]
MADAKEILANFEKAAIVMMSPPNQVSGEDYRTAEKIFLSFRRAKQPYSICKYMLENSSNTYVHFQAASTIKEAIVREWKLINENDKNSLREFLLNYVIGQSRCQDYVREQILSCVAIMFKKSAVTESGINDLDNLLSTIYQLKNSDSSRVRLKPYLSYLPIAVYEDNDLQIFEFFTIANRPKFGQADNNKFVTFRPSRDWDDMISNQSTINLFLELYQKLRQESRLCHLTLLCISQLISICGDVFPSIQSRMSYNTYLITSLIKARNRQICHGVEAQDLADVFNRIVIVDKLLEHVQDEAIFTFIDDLSHLTCACLENCVKEEMEYIEETYFSYACDQLLECWFSIVSEDTAKFDVNRISLNAIAIFECYLKCHLSEGRKSICATLTGHDAELEIDELDEDDRVSYGEQLLNIGILGRSVLSLSLPLLSQLLENTILTLRQYVSRPLSAGIDHNALMDDIHWLILIAGSVLTDENKLEVPLIPSAILRYSDNIPNSDNYANLVKLLSHICCNDSRSIDDNMVQLLHVEGINHVFVIVFLMLFISRIEQEVLQSAAADSLSPQVGKTIVWFLTRWSQAYLLPMENRYDHISLSLILTFGQDCDLGTQTVKFLIRKVMSNLTFWSSENDVAIESINLLSTVVDNKARCHIAVSCEDLWNLAVQQAGNTNLSTKKLSGAAQKQLACALIKAGSCVDDNDARNRFWSNVLQPLKSRFLAALQGPLLAKMIQDSALRDELCNTIDCCSGVALATTASSVSALFSYLLGILHDCVPLLQHFSNFPDMVETILEFFVSTTKSQIAYLNQRETNELFKLCLAIIQTYAKCSIGRFNDTVLAEEEKFTDLCLILQLLSHVTSKDYLDFSKTEIKVDAGQDDAISVIDVVLSGLNFIIPLMNENLLKIPDLCLQYFKLVSFHCEIHPGKLVDIPQNLSNSLMVSLDMGLRRFGSEVSKLALESITGLATFVYGKKCNKERNSLMIGIEVFMKSILDVVFSEDFDMDLLQPTSEALYCIICCHPIPKRYS